MKPQHEHPEAAAELEGAVRWYEQQSPGVGIKLLDRVSEARKSIGEWPFLSSILAGSDAERIVRSKAVRGFPLRIIYSVEQEAVFIVAYAHMRRKPGYWIDRLSR